MEFNSGRCLRNVLLAALIIGAGPVVASVTASAQTAQAETNTIRLTAPKNGQKVQGVVKLSATAADSASSMAFYVDGNPYESSTTGDASWDASAALPGEHTISVMAYSDSGAILGSDQVNVSVEQPISISSPHTGSSVSGLVDITAKANSGITSASFYVDDSFVSTAPPFDFQWDANNTQPGEHQITIKAYSANDNLLGQDTIYLNVTSPAEAAAKRKLMQVVLSNNDSPSSGKLLFPVADKSAATDNRMLLFPTFNSDTPLDQMLHSAYTVTSNPGYQGAFARTQSSSLPTDAQCAARIGRSSWEPRPENYTANHTMPTASQLSYVHSVRPTNGEPTSFLARVDGHFTGTTPEIIQWASCKWGFNTDVTAAVAAGESHWRSSGAGDWTYNSSQCPSGAVWRNGKCARSYGINQIKWPYNRATFPLGRNSTAFNLDYTLAYRRACFDGKIGYLRQRTSAYPSGSANYMLWGCVGQWFSGNWYDSGAADYINKIKILYYNRVWFNSYF